MAGLRLRGGLQRESGAFLLGHKSERRWRFMEAVYYDDLDPKAFDSGIIRFDGGCYPRLWAHCRHLQQTVLADIHTHPGGARQSLSDRAHPMIPEHGHIAMIAPGFARRTWQLSGIGVFRYKNGGHWQSLPSPQLHGPIPHIRWRGVI